ncbi:MAG TPA: VOC family protein, partial [Pseudosphingobacterium sp.]|nr:VOC family protein [Pseudosphingobacterium sp.]
LTGAIMSSTDPEKLARFYNEVLGIPLKLNRHGNMPAHWECDYNGIHFAILKRKSSQQPNENIVLSFRVDDINEFVAAHNIELIHPIMDLGDGAFVVSFKDTDGNTLRLWMHKETM